MVMVIYSLLSWWFAQGWSGIIRSFSERLVRVSHLFSLPILIRTLGSPWRRIITVPGASIDAKLRALGDNLVSRAIGFTVRMMVLITAALILLLTACYGALLVILWPLVPFLAVGSIIMAVLR